MGSPGGWEYQRIAQLLGKMAWNLILESVEVGVDIDWGKIQTLIEGSDRESACCPTAATKWSPALDEALRPCERVARNAGFLIQLSEVTVRPIDGQRDTFSTVPQRNPDSLLLQRRRR